MNTKQLRQKILDLAIRGKLVPQDPNDEPASVLLERIKAEKEQLIKEGKIKRGKKSTSTSDKPHYADWELPNGWVWCRLDDIFEVNPRNIVKDSTICGFVPMANVEDGFSGEHSFIERKWGEVKKGYSHFQDGDIAVAKISPCFENLKSTIFKSLPNSVGAGTTELVILRNHIIYAPYFLYLFKSQWYIGKGTIYFKGVVGQQRVNRDIFTSLVVPVPPLSEQKRISSAINNIFDLIDLIENGITGVNTCIDKLKQQILQLAISGKLVPQDPADEPAEVLLKRVNPNAVVSADTSHYDLPDSYCVVTLKDICKIISAKPFQIAQKQIQSKGKYPVVSQSANFIEGYTDSGCAYKIKTPIILFGDHTRNVKFIDFDFVVGADGTKLLLPLVLPQYVYLSTIYASNTIQNRGYSRHFSYLCKVSIPLPPFNEQRRIVAKVDELFEMIDQIQQSLE